MLVEFQIDDEKLLTNEEFIYLVKARASYICERCGATEDEIEPVAYVRKNKIFYRARLQSHHRDGNRKNNTLKNGECLCIACHNKHHEEKKNIGLRERNKNGQAKRAGLKGWEKINSMPEEERKIWLSNRANKIWESRRAKENGRDKL